MIRHSAVTKVNQTKGIDVTVQSEMYSFLEPAEFDVLVAKWNNHRFTKSIVWPAHMVLQGGVPSISCELVASLPLTQLSRVYGKKFAEKLFAISQQYAFLE